jgi:hypothetical protein
VHEVLPITTGCRLTVVYNLMRDGKGPAPEPPSYEHQQAEVAAVLQAWAADQQSSASGSQSESDAPTKLIYPLDHAYTPAEFGFETLKGADAAVANVIITAARQCQCDVHLALLTIAESGTAEYVDDFRWRNRRSEPSFEAGEIFDRHVALSEWRRYDGIAPELIGRNRSVGARLLADLWGISHDREDDIRRLVPSGSLQEQLGFRSGIVHIPAPPKQGSFLIDGWPPGDTASSMTSPRTSQEALRARLQQSRAAESFLDGQGGVSQVRDRANLIPG